MRQIPWLSFAVSLAAFGPVACSDSSDSASDGPSGTSADPSTTSTTTSGGTGGGTGSGGGSSSSTGAGAGPVDFEGTTRVDTGSGTAMAGSADVAIAPGGAIYVSWVDEQNGTSKVFVARSSDGGKTFGAPVVVDQAGAPPLVSMARHPYVAANDERVVVVFNDEAGSVYLYLANAADPLSFGAPTIVGSDITTDFRDFPKPLFLADSSLVVGWHGYPASGARVFVSREDTGFAAEEATGGAPGVPCECCPIDLLQSTGGDLTLAFRNNVSNVREMWLAAAPGAGDFADWNPVSTTEGTVNACPMQGPRLGQTASGDLVAVWSARGSQNTGAVHVAFSADGSSWSGGTPIAGFVADEPTLAITPSGKIFVTGVTGGKSSSMVISDDGGKTFGAPETLASPDGNLVTPQAEGSAGAAALAAVSSAGTVWLRRME